MPTAPWPALTYAVGDDLQLVLCEQQVGQSQQAVQLRRELLQPILRDIQTDQSSQVPQLLEGDCTLAEHTLVIKCQNSFQSQEKQTELNNKKNKVHESALTGGNDDSWFRSSHSSRRLGSAPSVSGWMQ